MGKYTVIKDLESTGKLALAIKEGLISTSILAHKRIYENYLVNKTLYSSKMKQYEETAGNFKISTMTVIRIVNDFQ